MMLILRMMTTTENWICVERRHDKSKEKKKNKDSIKTKDVKTIANNELHIRPKEIGEFNFGVAVAPCHWNTMKTIFTMGYSSRRPSGPCSYPASGSGVYGED
ncbi:hypothetical protein AgCh_029824 [Apium graveolens]